MTSDPARGSSPAVARWLGVHRIDLERCTSTNDEAARLARAGARHGTIVVADAQTAGRGREGRVWASPAGAGLYVSAILRPPAFDVPLAQVPPITLAIGIGVCDAIRGIGVAAALKWPNDILVDRQKLGGVLVEAQSQGARLESVVVGIGVNLAGPPPLPTATTLAACGVAAADHQRDAFLARLCSHVEQWVDRYVAIGLPAVIAAWHERMARSIYARATVEGSAITGEVAGLDDDGALLLRESTTAGVVIHRIRSGDVEVIQHTPASAIEHAAC